MPTTVVFVDLEPTDTVCMELIVGKPIAAIELLSTWSLNQRIKQSVTALGAYKTKHIIVRWQACGLCCIYKSHKLNWNYHMLGFSLSWVTHECRDTHSSLIHMIANLLSVIMFTGIMVKWKSQHMDATLCWFKFLSSLVLSGKTSVLEFELTTKIMALPQPAMTYGIHNGMPLP